MEKRPSRIERLRSSISERTGKFSLDRPRFSLPDKSKFHLPERPKFRLPDKSKFHLPDRPKFNIKKPNIRLPDAFARAKRPSTQEGQLSTESTAGSRRNIFDFATYPRIFDKMSSKKRGDHATSSPKDSRAESAESATFPRARKEKPRWAQRFGDAIYDRPEETATASEDGSPSWHQTSLEEPPRLSARTEEEILAAARAIPWEDTRKREYYEDDEEIQYMDYEQESSERSDRHPAPPRRTHKAKRGESYEHEEGMEIDPRLYGDQKRVHRDEIEENDWRADQQMMPEERFRPPIPRSRSLDEDMRAMEQEGYDGEFAAVDPRRFVLPRKAASEERETKVEPEEDEEGEPSSMQSDREQQASSGSSCDRRRRGVIEEIDSDEFFLRASGISQDDVHLGEYLTDKIRDALRSEDINALDDIELPPTPPQRPMRMRSRRKRKEASVESNEIAPPVKPKRERAAARRSREASIVNEVFRERTRSDSRSDSRHRVVYQTEGDHQREPPREPLDDIVVVKPARRKARSSSLRSQSQPPIETSVLSSPALDNVVPDVPAPATPPVVPVRRKRSHRETVMERRNGDVIGAPIVRNGHQKWETETESKKPTRPSRSRSRQSLIERLSGRDAMLTSQEDIRNLDAQLHRQDSGPEVAPAPPKRRSRSRTTSVAADEDRTSHGAESLPEAGYVEEDIPHEENGSMRDLSNGYAIVDKREKSPPRRLPPPRRKRDKFATLPKPVPPKRPQRAYSTLGPSKKKDIDMTSETISSAHLAPTESAPYIEIDGDEHRDLRSGEVLNKMQGRPLPAPPRPPRIKKEHTERPRTPFEFAEITTATQTDPLPDDMVIEEEITQAKLVVTPSRSGSQVLVSMERIPSPSGTSTPPVPPLPVSKFFRSEEEEEEEREEDIRMEYDTVSLTSPSPIRETDFDNKHKSAPHLQERVAEESQPRPQLRSGLLSDEPLRISSLEVGDLKVDRLSVSQIEAHKIVASEVDAMMITASEMRGGGPAEDSFSPAIIRELMAIRSHLETVMSQAQERQRERETASHKPTDIPTTDGKQISEQQPAEPQQLAPQESTESQLAQQKSTESQLEQLATESQTTQQLLMDLQLAQQLLAELNSAHQQSTELQLAQQQTAEQQPIESQPAQQQPAESQLAQQQPAESQLAQQQLAESQLAQQQSAESQLAQQQSAESQLAQQQPAESQQQSTESQPEEQQPAESQFAQQQLPAELEPAQQLLADLQLARQLLAELQSASQQSAELQLAEQQPAEQSSAEQPSAEQRESRETTESSETAVNVSAFTEDGKTEAGEDQKVVKTDVIDVRDKEMSHTPSIAQAKESPSPQTLPIDDLESKDTNDTTTHLLSVAQDTQDKSLRILDSEHPLTLSSTSGSHVAESRASYPSSDVPSAQLSESKVSPERVAESPSSCIQTTATNTTATATTESDATSTDLQPGSEDNAPDSKEQICRKSRSSSPRKSRSRSSSPKGIVRQTASPVRSLPPVISVTPDTPDSTVPGRGASTNAQPQRAVISYSSDTGQSVPKTVQPQRAVISHSFDLEQSLQDRQRESSQSPISPFPLNTTHFIAIPASEIPASFFALSETPTSRHVDSEPGVIDTTQQLLRALRLTGIKAMRHFVRYLTSAISADDTREKVREVELVICALLLLIAGLLIYYFSRTQNVTHLHHWDYFNPPQ